MSDRLFDFTMSVLQRRVSRRKLLSKMAVAASAVAVAPVRYTLRPLTAMAVITCGDCSSGSQCCDGWTTFCCSLTGSNTCPSYSYMGGWWKCTNYTGSQLCSTQGVRYYVDCNRTPTASCPNGCHCTGDSCSKRRTCCNVFRYGQCNTEVAGSTEVVCRVVTCSNPCRIFENCNCTYFEQNAVCAQDAGCL